MIEIKVPVTIQHPDRTIHGIFGDNIVPGETEIVTATFHIDESAAAGIAILLADRNIKLG